MGQNVKGPSELCPLPPGPLKELPRHMRFRTIFMAVSLTFILATTGLVVFQPPPAIPPPLPPLPPPPSPLQLTPHAAIAIDGDANFIATALLEGWPGDGSPENPFIINGLDIDLGDGEGNCIMISNTRVNFTISNCNLTGANHAADGELIWSSPGDDFELPRHEMNKGAGIHLDNVSNGELVSNTCNNNSIGIDLFCADSNTVSSNNCTNNGHGIVLWGSDSNTVTNNTCLGNTECGIYLYESGAGGGDESGGSNIVTNNTCSSNTGCGIYLNYSFLNMLVNNTCNENGYSGISVSWFPPGGGLRGAPPPNTVEDNTCNENGHSGICLTSLEQSTVVNNTCNSNDIGIWLFQSCFITVTKNTCNSNDIGISVSESSGNEFSGIGQGSHSNTIANNTCNDNDIGISLEESHSTTVSDNTCNNNRIGIYVDDESESITVTSNTCLGNTEHDIVDESEHDIVDEWLAHREYVAKQFVWFLAGCGMILVVSVVAFVKFRRMGI